eukprot:6196789-Pleurochrysis_carterae.AAC.2
MSAAPARTIMSTCALRPSSMLLAPRPCQLQSSSSNVITHSRSHAFDFTGATVLSLYRGMAKNSKNRAEQWWQPVLPCFARDVAAGVVTGKGNTRHKKFLQRMQMSIAMRARAREGRRRNAVLEAERGRILREKVREVYRQHGEILRAKALAKMAREAAASEAAKAEDGKPQTP